MKRTIAACAITALAVGGGSATAATLITGKDVKNGSLTSADIKNGSLKSQDIKKNSISLNRLSKGSQALLRRAGTPGKPGSNGANGAAGTNGSNGAPGAPGADGDDGTSAQALSAGNWGAITRNTIGSPVSELRNGPGPSFGQGTPPPFGTGSLGLEVAFENSTTDPGTEAASFGNEVDFVGDDFASITQLGFHYFTTNENNARQADGRNLPNIRMEIDPNLGANPTNYSQVTFQPAPATAFNRWSAYQDATSSGDFVLTGAAGTATGCTLAKPCTFAQLKTALNDGGQAATIFTVAVGKGRDAAFVGAIDGLRINGTVFDFEEDGVVERAAN